MRSVYPLQAALELREREVDEEKRALADRNAALSAAEAQLLLEQEKAQKAELALHEHRTAPLEQGIAADFLWKQNFERRLRSEFEVARAVVGEAEGLVRQRRGELEQQRARLATARAELKAVEKHRERWELEEKKAAEKRAEEQADDLSASRFGRD